MKELGILVDTLGPSQESLCLINSINKLAQDHHIVLFYEHYDRPIIKHEFCTMQNYYAWQFQGPLMSTSLKNTQLMLTFPLQNKKYFYIWDFEWFMKLYDINHLSDIYNNKNLEYLTRSEDHQRIFKDAWGQDSTILQDFNHEQLIRII